MMRTFLQQNRTSIAFVLLLLMVRGAIADWSPVPTGSMKPTILEGDVLLINRLAYDIKVPFSDIRLARLGEPERGDIVVFRLKGAENRLVKRLIGLPGDVVALNDNQLEINGISAAYSSLKRLADPENELDFNTESLEWLSDGGLHIVRRQAARGRGFSAVRVPEGHYLMLGDNRDNSADSRVFGFVPRSALIGRSSRLLASFDMDKFYLPRLSRWGSELDALSP